MLTKHLAYSCETLTNKKKRICKLKIAEATAA